MRFSALLAAAATASLAGLSSARIVGVAVPATIRPGDGFNAIIQTEDYIQSVLDIAIGFGVAPGAGSGGDLANVLGTFYLGPEQSNVLYNVTKWVDVPAGIQDGPSTFTAALYSLFGAGNAPTLTTYNVSITVGGATSTNYVSSLGG